MTPNGNLRSRLHVPAGKAFADYGIVTELKTSDGKVVATNEKQRTAYDEKVFDQDFVIARPSLWSPDTPVLYSAVSKVYEGNTLKNEYTTPFGIRSIEIIPNKGFYLNGQRTVFKGVCNHHDPGPLGGIANEAGIRRQIRILKAIFLLHFKRRRNGIVSSSPCFIRTFAHHKFQYPSLHQIFVTEPRLIPCFSIECCRLNKFVFR